MYVYMNVPPTFTVFASSTEASLLCAYDPTN